MVCYTTMKAMADLLGPFRRRGHSGFAASGERATWRAWRDGDFGSSTIRKWWFNQQFLCGLTIQKRWFNQKTDMV